MDSINFATLLSFVFITIFTPGPNNISSASMGISFGYRKTLNYLMGIVVGFFWVMLLSGVVSKSINAIFPAFQSIMRIIGGIYILWLAYKTLNSSYQFTIEESAVLKFSNGFLLQALNPKGMVFGLTLYTTFLTPILDQWLFLILSALLLAGVAFMAPSTWAISGAAIRRYMHNPNLQKALNTVLALLLVYTAIDISGVFG